MTGTAAVVKGCVSPPSVDAPRDVPAEATLRLVGDAHPGRSRLLAERVDAGLVRRRCLGLARALGGLDLGDRANDEDLLAVDRHVERAREPLIGDSPGKPAAQLVHRHLAHHPSSSILNSGGLPPFASRITALHACSRSAIPHPAATGRSGYRPAMPQTIRPIKADELAAWFEAFGTAFYIWPTDPQAGRGVSARRRSTSTGRSARSMTTSIVGTFRSVPDAAHAAGRRTGAGQRGLGRQRPADPSAARNAQPDDRPTTSRARRPAAMSRASSSPRSGRSTAGSGMARPRGMPTGRSGRASMSFQVEPVGTRRDRESPRRRASSCRPSTPSTRPRQPGEIDRPDHRWEFELGLVEWPGRPTLARADRDPSRRRRPARTASLGSTARRTGATVACPTTRCSSTSSTG